MMCEERAAIGAPGISHAAASRASCVARPPTENGRTANKSRVTARRARRAGMADACGGAPATATARAGPASHVRDCRLC